MKTSRRECPVTRGRTPAQVAGLLFAALCTSAGSAAAQSGPVLTVDGVGRGTFDSNMGRSPSPLEAYGGSGDVLVRAASRLRAPALQFEYAASVRHSSPAHSADGVGHRLNVLARAALAGWLRMEVIGRGSRGGTDEDLATGDETSLASRLDIQPLPATRLRAYSAYRLRTATGAEVASVGGYGGLELRQRIGGSTTLLADARYEEFHPPDASREWQRRAILFGLGQAVSGNTAIEAEVRFREREYPSRLLALEDGATARRDTDLRYGVAVVFNNDAGTEVRLEIERDRRRSNDVSRGYDADRATFVVRRRIFALGARRDLPRIDERPADVLRRAADVAMSSGNVRGVLVAGTGMCAIVDAGALCWPAPTQATSVPAPALVTGSWQRVAAAAGRACGLDADGVVHCWNWRTGVDGSSAVDTQPQPVRSDVRFIDVAVGSSHACALTETGTAYCWGDNGEGQLGTGLATPANRPAAVTGGLRFASVTVGASHTCALDDAGTAYCWGSNKSGQSAAGTLRRTLTPRPVSAGTFTAITAGASHTCALSKEGRAYCWGESTRGQAGSAGGMVADQPNPIESDVRFTRISAGWAHTCALTETGHAFCWGMNRYGQLGSGSVDQDAHALPVAVRGDLIFSDLSASFRTCGLDMEGQLHCWGGTGQDARADVAAARPRQVRLAAENRPRRR
jgi:hypothetical protein